MDDLKPFVLVTVYDGDLIQDQIEVEEKPALITQDSPTECDSECVEKQSKKRRRKKKLKFTHIKKSHKSQSDNSPAAQLPIKTEPTNIKKEVEFEYVTNSSGKGASENIPGNNCTQSNLQIASVASNAESFFNSENNNDSVLTTFSLNDESKVLDPLQNDCDLETIDHVPATNEKDDFNPLETDIKLLTPYIRKICGNCKKITDLMPGTLSMQKCKSCKHQITTYCCILCLQVENLSNTYIHIFKKHYMKVMSGDSTSKTKLAHYFTCNNCDSHFASKEKLKEHESTCIVSTNLFCKFCPIKKRLKREMREHMISVHGRCFNKNELENMLDEIVYEADAVTSLLTQHNSHCTNCKKQVPLTHPIQRRSTHCITCSNKLVYYCSNVGFGCSSYPFTNLSTLQLHLRYHANRGWTRKWNNNNIRNCHLCGYADERAKVKAHMLAKHPDIFLCKCDLCGVSLKNVSAWKRHQAKYCPVTHQKLQCGHCWFMCFRKKRLRRHMKNVHTHLYTGKRSQCKKCGITWAGLYRLRWHESRCSGDFKAERAKQRELWAMRGVVTLS